MFFTHTLWVTFLLSVVCSKLYIILYYIILYIILGIEEEEMQVVRGCVKKICYKWYKCYAAGRTIVMILMTPCTMNGCITVSKRDSCAEADSRLYVGWNFSPHTLRLCWLHIIQKNSSLAFASGESLFLLDLSPFAYAKYGLWLEWACFDERTELLLIPFRHMDDFLTDVDAVVSINFLDFIYSDDIGTMYAQEFICG